MTNKKNGDDFLQYLIDNEEDKEDDLQFLSLVAMHFIEEEDATRINQEQGGNKQHTVKHHCHCSACRNSGSPAPPRSCAGVHLLLMLQQLEEGH